MTKLSDTQCLILSAAAQRDGNIALPLPTSLRGGTAKKVVGALLGKGYLAEAPAGREPGTLIEELTGEVACVAFDRHRILRKHRGGVKKDPIMLAAMKTVAKPDPVRASRSHEPDAAAEATAGESVHSESPSNSVDRTCPHHQRIQVHW